MTSYHLVNMNVNFSHLDETFLSKNRFELDQFAQFSAILQVNGEFFLLTNVEVAMTVQDVATHLNVDEKTIYRLAQKGDLPGFKVLGSWRFQRPGLETWIAERKDQVAAKQK